MPAFSPHLASATDHGTGAPPSFTTAPCPLGLSGTGEGGSARDSWPTPGATTLKLNDSDPVSGLGPRLCPLLACQQSHRGIAGRRLLLLVQHVAA